MLSQFILSFFFSQQYANHMLRQLLWKIPLKLFLPQSPHPYINTWASDRLPVHSPGCGDMTSNYFFMKRFKIQDSQQSGCQLFDFYFYEARVSSCFDRNICPICFCQHIQHSGTNHLKTIRVREQGNLSRGYRINEHKCSLD